jgi:hypothetical protein
MGTEVFHHFNYPDILPSQSKCIILCFLILPLYDIPTLEMRG